MRSAAALRTVTPIRKISVASPRRVPRSVSPSATLCPTCGVRQICLAGGLEPDAMRLLDELVTMRTRYRKGDSLFRAGDRFTALYAIRSGAFKTVLVTEDGHEQVAGFHIAGDIIGTDGVENEHHECQAVALEDAEVCELSFDRWGELGRGNPQFQRHLYRVLSREIARERDIMFMLGTMHADQRLCAFLLDLSLRYQSRGYSASEFVLRMTREEIGSYLGLKLETVSRLLSRFDREGLVRTTGRNIRLLDRVALRQLLQESA